MESYLINDDSVVEIKRNDWSAQTFTPVKDHDFNFLQTKLYASASLRSCFIELQETTGGEPNGNILHQWHPQLIYMSQYSPGEIYQNWTWDAVPLKAGVKYAIVIRNDNMRWADKVYWRYDAGDATYPRGERLFSNDEGATWTHYPNDCLMFCAWGDPPAPKPPPPPPKDHFAILSVEQEDTGAGIKFLVATNVPCHLYMLWTDQNPEKHTTPIIRRGALWKNAIRFCFVNWNINEQEEEGYTLYHTFTKEPWAVCETRWFTFRAKIEDKWTTSVGPIFKKHRVAGPITITLYPDPDPGVTCCDGFALADRGYYGVDWAELHGGAGTDGSAGGSGIGITIQAGRNTDKWRRIQKSFLLYDASPIPPGATILNAKLRVYGAGRTGPLNFPLFGMCVVNSFPESNTNITLDDYQNVGTTLLSNLIILWDDFDPVGWNEFALNEAGLAVIVPGEIVKLGLRDFHYDVMNSPPPWVSQYLKSMSIVAADHPTDPPPELVVTYMP